MISSKISQRSNTLRTISSQSPHDLITISSRSPHDLLTISSRSPQVLDDYRDASRGGSAFFGDGIVMAAGGIPMPDEDSSPLGIGDLLTAGASWGNVISEDARVSTGRGTAGGSDDQSRAPLISRELPSSGESSPNLARSRPASPP